MWTFLLEQCLVLYVQTCFHILRVSINNNYCVKNTHCMNECVYAVNGNKCFKSYKNYINLIINLHVSGF